MNTLADLAKLARTRLTMAAGLIRAGDLGGGLKQLRESLMYFRGMAEAAPTSDFPYVTRGMFTSRTRIVGAAETGIKELETLHDDWQRIQATASLKEPILTAGPECLRACLALAEWLDAVANDWTPNPDELAEAYHALNGILDRIHIDAGLEAIVRRRRLAERAGREPAAVSVRVRGHETLNAALIAWMKRFSEAAQALRNDASLDDAAYEAAVEKLISEHRAVAEELLGERLPEDIFERRPRSIA